LTAIFFKDNTLNSIGGKVVPLNWIEELSKVCKDNNVALHMDGARIFNAAEFLQVPVARVARDVDSVCFCLSKNLCCPVGSMLLGRTAFIEQARRYRKSLGGLCPITHFCFVLTDYIMILKVVFVKPGFWLVQACMLWII